MNRYTLALLVLIIASGATLLHGREYKDVAADGSEANATRVFNIKSDGAIGDGAELETRPIQKAIDACHDAGGGIVTVPAGDFQIGTIERKSNVTLSLDFGDNLLGSTNEADYPIEGLVEFKPDPNHRDDQRTELSSRMQKSNPTAQMFVNAPVQAAPDSTNTRRADRQAKYLDTGGERKLEVAYKNVSGRDLTLDLYYPTAKRSKKCPVVVFTHGGGWAAGNRYKAASGSFELVFSRLIKEGFAVAPVTYRLAKKDSNVAMRDCVIDCKDAIRFLAKNCESLKIDPTRICVMGDSAGGHIAQMLLLASPEQLPGDPDLAEVAYQMIAGVSWYGPCDFEKMDLFNHDDRPDFKDRFGPRILGSDSGPEDKLARYREVSPINYLTATSAPLLMIQGDKDTTIPVKHAYHMRKKAEELNAPVDIVIVKNSGHNWRRVGADIEPDRTEIIERTVKFFVNQLHQ